MVSNKSAIRLCLLAPQHRLTQAEFGITAWVFSKEEKFTTKWCTTLCIYVKQIIRNRVGKLEFRQVKK